MSTLAIMYTISTYGVWLQGDPRGWVDDGIVYPANPPLQAMNRELLKHPPFYFDRSVRQDVGQAMGGALTKRVYACVLAMCVQSWHAHFVTARTRASMDEVVKCAKDAVRWFLRVDRPIWGTDYDKQFCFDNPAVRSRINYVERHNLEDGLPRKPWSFIREFHDVSI